MARIPHRQAAVLVSLMFFVGAAAWLLSCADREPPTAGRPMGPGSAQWEPSAHVDPTPALLELGKTTYTKQCAPCHGTDGRGTGDAAYLLYPKPRDFTAGMYRLVSTWEGIPTDEDLFRTISRGMPGSAMPSWAHLPEQRRWALVHYVKSLSETPIEVPPTTMGDAPAGVIQPPPEPEYTEQSRTHAAELFTKGCAPCHGITGRGDGAQKQFDSKGFPTRPRDLTTGIFKGVPTAEHVYRRIVAGLPGSPMPNSGYLHGDDAWALVHYVLAMSSDDQRRRAEMYQFQIQAKRVAALPTHPDDGLWSEAERINLHLMPLWWRSERPEELTVQAMHDGKEIAFLLTWADETNDHTAMRPQDFRDAAAIEFSTTPDPPFFAMGNAGEHVNIWMWKSERQADIEPAFQDLEKVYPNIGIDAYPNVSKSPVEQPLRRALTLESDPTYVTGWGAGNIVSDPTRRSPVEDLQAQGFGTLAARPRIDQNVQAQGVYTTGTYRVVFRRGLKGNGDQSVGFGEGKTLPAAFAVWNGSAGDRDGKKSVTIWQNLYLEP